MKNIPLIILLVLGILCVTANAAAPPRVTTLGSSNIKGQQVTLNWTVPSGTPIGSTFEIRISPISISTLNWASRTIVDAGASSVQAVGSVQSVSIAGLNQNTKYYFAMKVKNSLGQYSTVSNVISCTTNDVTATVTLSWDPNAEADLTGYRMHYASSDGNETFPPIEVGNSTVIDVGGLSYGVQYEFQVTAVNAGGLESMPSNQVVYTP